jgi:hypothetical protein
MKTMLIPVDFTATSENAINYAIEWSKAYEYKRIILLKAMYDSMFDDIIASEGYVNQDYLTKERSDKLEALATLSTKLTAEVGPDIQVATIASELPLLRAILETIQDEQPELVLVGSDNSSYSGNSFVAANVISIAKISPVRVLIVPSAFKYQPLKQLLVPVDFNRLDDLGPLLHAYQAYPIKWHEIKLQVLNVDPKEKYLYPDEQFEQTKATLQENLKNFNYEISYSNNKNIIRGIMNFSAENKVELIVALPGKHSFLYALTHRSISQAIYENATEPVLILK